MILNAKTNRQCGLNINTTWSNYIEGIHKCRHKMPSPSLPHCLTSFMNAPIHIPCIKHFAACSSVLLWNAILRHEIFRDRIKVPILLHFVLKYGCRDSKGCRDIKKNCIAAVVYRSCRVSSLSLCSCQTRQPRYKK